MIMQRTRGSSGKAVSCFMALLEVVVLSEAFWARLSRRTAPRNGSGLALNCLLSMFFAFVSCPVHHDSSGSVEGRHTGSMLTSFGGTNDIVVLQVSRGLERFENGIHHR